MLTMQWRAMSLYAPRQTIQATPLRATYVAVGRRTATCITVHANDYADIVNNITSDSSLLMYDLSRPLLVSSAISVHTMAFLSPS